MALPVAPVFDRIRLVPRPTDFLDRNTGASGELFYEKETKTLRVYNGLQRGGFEVLSEERLRINTANIEVASVLYNTYVGNDGVSNKYYFNNDFTNYAPALTFVVGYTYRFDQSNFTNLFYPNPEGGTLNPHPLEFSITENGTLAGGTTYLDGVVYLLDGAEVTREKYLEDFTGATTRSIQITVTSNTPTTLYYYCTNHTGMGAVINVGMPGSGAGSAGGSASITASDTAPTEPSAGALWYNSATGYLYVYVDDGDSQQWVQPVAGNVFSGVYGDLIGTPTFATVASTGDWNDIQNKPTIPATLTDLGISDGTANQVLTTDGAGNFTFEDGGGGSAYDQSLNTTDDVTFDEITATTSVTAPSVITNGVGVTNFTSSTSLTLSATDGVFLSGIARSSEIVNTLTGATSTVDHSLNLGSVWNHTSIAANFTANFTNVPTTNNRTISVALILNQGASPFLPNAVQINGGAQSINWEDASAPTPNANQTDVVVFTLVRTSGSWSVLGSLTTYG